MGLVPRRYTSLGSFFLGMNNTIDIKALRNFVEHNEVVYQVYGELVEVSNEIERENKNALLNHLDKASSVETYEKNHFFIKDDFSDLNSWSQDSDLLFLLQTIGVLICIPKTIAMQNQLIAA